MPWAAEEEAEWRLESQRQRSSLTNMGSSPVRFVMGLSIVEPTLLPRESFTRVACASLALTRTLMAHEADTHLARFRF